MPYAFILCGPPGSGKSSWLEKNRAALGNPPICNTDTYIDNYAKAQGKTYQECFVELYPDAEKDYIKALATYQYEEKSLVIDRTNATDSSRKKTLALINPRYKKVAIYFPSYSPEVLIARIQKRGELGGHTVPEQAIKDMHRNYLVPRYSEGFDLVVSASELERILTVMEFKNA